MMLFLLAAPDAGAAAQQLNPIQKLLGGNPLLPFLLIGAVFYFLLIRPQQQRQRAAEDLQKKLAVGDEVITTGGLVGKVTYIAEDIITVEVGEKTRVRVLRSHVNAGAPGGKSEKPTEKPVVDKKAQA